MLLLKSIKTMLQLIYGAYFQYRNNFSFTFFIESLTSREKEKYLHISLCYV